ncbi:MAG: GPW/gp25 family protein [Desulfobulbaceae bacterium]|nr:GPW/gp25 family protein [Pseudomonadota bacterium]MCG2747002.1 GPW/gp25 family protein [Desulfobulbaceae bacterium]
MARNAAPTRLINWPLFPLPDKNGFLRFPTLEESVRQSIQIILRTRPRERLMRPNFGAGLENLLHEQNTLSTRREIADLITESLERWEKRIILDRVDVWENEDQPTTVRIEIAYRLWRTNQPQQIGITMEFEA